MKINFCPHCGGETKLFSRTGESGRELYHCECVVCKCKTSEYIQSSTAIQHWNKRKLTKWGAKLSQKEQKRIKKKKRGGYYYKYE